VTLLSRARQQAVDSGPITNFAPETSYGWQPVAGAERLRVIDVLRGLALFGVLLVNLMGAFRISLFAHIGESHNDPGRASEIINWAIDTFVEFKALTLFSFLFGVGTAIQAERAGSRGVDVLPFLMRRFGVLLALGVAHMLLIWNGDILALYGVCGLFAAPLVRARPAILATIGVGAIIAPHIVGLPIPWPSTEAMRAQAARATFVYANGGFFEILGFRCDEARRFIVPLLIGSLPRTFGLMLLGVAAWRTEIVQRRPRWLWAVLIGGAAFAFVPMPENSVPLAFAYAAALLLWATPSRLARMKGIAALGQMALTNYLIQSVILSLIFYRYGLGLFGKVAPAPALPIAVAVYAAQVVFSRWWLERFRFGPVEWLWRSLTYGRRQPMHRTYNGRGADPS
jgi:uncharacterized protein